MKKFSFLFAAALLSISSFASTPYSVYVKGENVNSDNCKDVLKDGGSVKYDNATSTLTLTNAHITYNGDAINFYASGMTIKLVGHNSIDVTGSGSYGLDAEYGLDITGDGTLSITASATGIYADDLSLSGGCTVIAYGDDYGVSCVGGALVINESTLSAQGNDASITGAKKLTMTDVVFGTNHTYDATAQKFFDANGHEAKDYILIEPQHGESPIDARWKEMGKPFKLDDMNGKTFDLADYLKRGQFVLMFCFGTWSGMCYDFNSTGVFNDINALPNVTVVAVEGDDATVEDLKGTGDDTMGDFTTVNGKPITYPIVVDNANRDAMATVSAFYDGPVPTLVLITPEGYMADVYGHDWGFYMSSSNEKAVAAIEDVVKNAPKAYHKPLISFRNLEDQYEVNTKYDVNCDVISVAPYYLNWHSQYDMSSFEETAEGATVSWKTPGTKTLDVYAINGVGSGHCKKRVEVVNSLYDNKMDGYLSYSTKERYGAVGGPTNFSWAARFRAVDLNGVTQVEGVDFYSDFARDYKLTIAQSEPDASAPGSTLYEKTYTVTDVDQWVSLPLDKPVAVNSASDLWIVFSCSDVQGEHPATGCSYVGNPNGSLISLDGATWQNIVTEHDVNYTWMIRCTTNVQGLSTIREFPYTWDFDDGTWQGWTNADNDGDTFVWMPYYVNAAYIGGHAAGHSGDCCIMSESYNNSTGILYPDNWFISPAIAMPAKAKLSWWEKQYDQSASAFSEKHAVYISSSNMPVDFMATTPVFEGEELTSNYVQQVVDLGDKYAGQMVYIAFRHFDCYDGFQLCIDDITVDGDRSAVETVDNAQTTMRKYIRDGQVYIVRDGKTYNALGVEVR